MSFLLSLPHRGCFLHRVDACETGKRLPRSSEVTQAIFACRTIVLPLHNFFFKVLPRRAQTFFSGTLPVQKFVVTIVNQRKENEAHAFIQALIVKAQFYPWFNDNFFVSKEMLLKSLCENENQP